MRHYREYLLEEKSSLHDALKQLDVLAADAILFIVDGDGVLKASLTDGDIRRGFIQGLNLQDDLVNFAKKDPKYIDKSNYTLQDIIDYRQKDLKVVPVLDEQRRVVNVINFREQNSYLPLDAVIMAGGKGTRLLPLTETIPKPLLKIGDKCIIDHNVDRLKQFGVDDFWISIGHFGEQIEAHFRQKKQENSNIHFVTEEQPLGTIGAVRQIKNLHHNYVLVTNSDLLTTLDYEEFFLDFLEKEADMAVVTIPYQVDVPYAVMETSNHHVVSFKEKPSYTYYSNGGIYIIKRSLLEYIPENAFFNSTDLMETVLAKGLKLISFPNRNYWLDIGKHEDYKKAQEDIKHLDLH